MQDPPILLFLLLGLPSIWSLLLQVSRQSHPTGCTVDVSTTMGQTTRHIPSPINTDPATRAYWAPFKPIHRHQNRLVYTRSSIRSCLRVLCFTNLPWYCTCNCYCEMKMSSCFLFLDICLQG